MGRQGRHGGGRRGGPLWQALGRVLAGLGHLGEGAAPPRWPPGPWPAGLVAVVGGPGSGATAGLLGWARQVVAAGLPLVWLDCDRSLEPSRLPRPVGLGTPACPVAAAALGVELLAAGLAAVVVVDSWRPVRHCGPGRLGAAACRLGLTPRALMAPGAGAHAPAALGRLWCRARGAAARAGGGLWVACGQGPADARWAAELLAWAGGPTISGADPPLGPSSQPEGKVARPFRRGPRRPRQRPPCRQSGGSGRSQGAEETMKHPRLTWPLLAVAFGLTACEEKSTGDIPAAAADAAKVADAAAKGAETVAGAAAAPTPPPPPPPPAPPPMPSAAEVCGEVVMALKSKNEAKFGGLATPATTAALANHEAKEHIAKSLAEGTCGAAKVEEDRASVTVTAMGAPQDVPFVKLADGWKFDGVAFLEKYPVKSLKGGKKAPAQHLKGKEHGKHKK